MDETKGVQEDMREDTRNILEGVDVVAFTVDFSGYNKGCNMVNIHHQTNGYITLNDALANQWRVYDMETDELQGEFGSIEEIMDAGWKVST